MQPRFKPSRHRLWSSARRAVVSRMLFSLPCRRPDSRSPAPCTSPSAPLRPWLRAARCRGRCLLRSRCLACASRGPRARSRAPSTPSRRRSPARRSSSSASRTARAWPGAQPSRRAAPRLTRALAPRRYCVSVKALMTSVSVKPTIIELDEVGARALHAPRLRQPSHFCAPGSRACAHSRRSRDAGRPAGADRAAHGAERVHRRQAGWRKRWCVCVPFVLLARLALSPASTACQALHQQGKLVPMLQAAGAL